MPGCCSSTQFVDAAPSQHASSTASMPDCTRQSCAAAPFTVRPTFLHYGWCGPYGGIGAHAETHPEAVLATSSCWWQRGSTPRWVSHGLRPLHGVHRSAACARTRTRCPFCTALSRPRADRISLLPSQVARSSRPSPLTMARDRGRASLAAAAATSLSAARGGASTVVRLYGACAHVACMHMHCTAYRHAY
jgi:hypothetical protein